MKRIVWCAAFAIAALGCGVPRSQYDAAVADADKAKTACDDKLKASRSETQKEIDDLKAKLAEAESKADASSEATRGELDELRKQKAAAEARARLFEEFVAKFKKMIDSGKLDITVRRGQIVLALGTDILFDTGKTEIKPEGRAALGEVADALKSVAGRRFQVAGHTDNLSIKTVQFPSNWELSTARAVEVVKLLVERGVKSDALSAAGYAEFDPAQSNAGDKGRSRNRRIEIVIVPNIEELVKMPEIGAKVKEQRAKEPGAGATEGTEATPPPKEPTPPPAAAKPKQPLPPPPPASATATGKPPAPPPPKPPAKPKK
jgi:chemotaxis protein MotB